MPAQSQALIVRIGKKLRPAINSVVARYSDVPNDPVLDAGSFEWTGRLRAAWKDIRAEAAAVLANPDHLPALSSISPDHKGIAPTSEWKSFFLHGYGNAVPENLARCPRTAKLLETIPRLNSAFFSILQPGAHIPPHRGVTKGLLTCHLGLFVPPGDSCRMRVDDRIVHWAEGETLLFDDTYRHEVWNDSNQTRVVLLIQTERPARFPGNAVAGAFLWGVRRSSFVRDGVRNLESWNDNVKRLENAFDG